MSTKQTPFSLISLGCARTLVDSEHMIDDLHHAGFKLVPEGSAEEVIVLNTCSFIQAAIDETERNINDLIKRKKKGDIAYLAVVGCYTSRFKKTALALKYPDVDLWLNTQEQAQLKPRLSELVFKEKFQPSQRPKYVKLTPSHFSYLKISEGCDNWCSFCTIPKIRGTHTSKTLESIVKEAEKQISFGAKELILIAEDTTAWGEDIYGKPRFPLLLETLAQLPIKWVRPMYIFPSRVDQELIDVMAKYPTITNYIDMPVQHVNNALLEAMNRRHDKQHLMDIMTAFKKAIPDIVFRSTFIAGYPGETESHVEELLDFLREYPFGQLGCFGYSDETGTRSIKQKNKVDDQTIQKRIETIMNAQYNIVETLNQSLVNQTLECIYEGNQTARSQYQAPDVDGSIFVSNASKLSIGSEIKVIITKAKGYDLTGNFLPFP